MSNTSKKGKLLEDWVADQIVLKGIDPKARRDSGSGSGNREKADISTSMMVLGQSVGIECKNHKVVKMKDWFEQAEKLEVLGLLPLIVFKLHGHSIENTLVTLKLDTFLDLAVKANGTEIKVETLEDPDLRWKINNVMVALKALDKKLREQ